MHTLAKYQVSEHENISGTDQGLLVFLQNKQYSFLSPRLSTPVRKLGSRENINVLIPHNTLKGKINQN